MLRLAKYLKPYILQIFLAILFLFVQANADLALPDYMSRIVDNGIQQGGIEDSVPEAIRETMLKKTLIFLSDSEDETILENYTLIDQDSVAYETYLEEYPILADEPVYVLNDIDAETREELNELLSESLMIVYSIQQVIDNPDAAQEMGFGDSEFEMPELEPGTDIFDLLEGLPQLQINMITNTFSGQIEVLGQEMATQVSIKVVNAEYDAIGLDMGSLQTSYILAVGLEMLLISLLGGGATISAGYLASRVAAAVARDIRRDLFIKVENFSSAEFNAFSTASLITRSTNDITQVQMVVFMIMRMVLFAPIMGIGSIIRAVNKGGGMTWILAAAVITLLSFVIIVFIVALPKFRIIQSLIDRLNLVTRENLSGMLVIRAFNKQHFEENRFDLANIDLTKTNLFVSRVMVTMMPFMMMLMNGLSILIIWVGAHQVAELNMQVGDMMAFLQYAMHVVFSFLMITMMFIFLPRASVSGARIADVLETDLSILDPEEPKQLPSDLKGKIEFKDVCFKYPGAEDCVINHISFTAEPGKTTAFIGSTGCGKSTVINLIPRFYDVTEGQILIDGLDVREVSQKDLRDKIGYVPQKGTLFSGTIESNLKYGDNDASEELLKESIEIAQAGEFVFSQEEGITAEIAQGGTNVSGGQKQRLSIARALVKRPPIYIFDDSFSALDFKTDSMLRKALKDKTGESTVLIVTQRVATVKSADQIIVLDQGMVVGKGTHKDLMENCETYQQIAMSQLSQEELS